jgi:hypothetical protein
MMKTRSPALMIALKVFDDQAGAPGTISALSPYYRQVVEGGADVQFLDDVGSRSKRGSCAANDEADAWRQKGPARS